MEWEFFWRTIQIGIRRIKYGWAAGNALSTTTIQNMVHHHSSVPPEFSLFFLSVAAYVVEAFCSPPATCPHIQIHWQLQQNMEMVTSRSHGAWRCGTGSTSTWRLWCCTSRGAGAVVAYGQGCPATRSKFFLSYNSSIWWFSLCV